MVLQAPAALRPDTLAAALQAVFDRHAALRARLVRGADGAWTLDVPHPSAVDAAACTTQVVAATGNDGAALAVGEWQAAVDRLDPEAGAMVQAVWFDAGPD